MAGPVRIAFVVGTTAGGTGAHVRMLAAGCAASGQAVTVLGPAVADAAFGFAALPGVTFTPVEFGSRPRLGDVAAVRRLRHAFRAADAVHAHGLRAGALSVLARSWARRAVRPGLVVTVHNAPPYRGGAAALVYLVLERMVARGADLVLCVSGDLERRMRAAGAWRVARAVVPAEPASAAASAAVPAAVPAVAPAAARRALPGGMLAARAAGRPVVLAAGRLAPQKGLRTLIAAAVAWRDLDPAPLLVIAGDGPLGAELRARAVALGVDAEFPGHRDDVPALLAAAAVVVLPSLWEGQSLVLQEALRAGAAIVASRAGGTPELAGEDAVLLVPPGDAAALATAVRAVLADPALAARLGAAARQRAVALPSAADAVAGALAWYATVTRQGPRRPGG